MRTKTLLLIAAIAAAGAATSMAQVFSVNAVGYVNKEVPAGGFALISNPLIAATNTVGELFKGVPNGFQVYIYTPGAGYTIGTFDDLENAFTPAPVNDIQIRPGQGVFVRNPTTAAVTVTFVGEVPQGDLKTPLVAGLQIVSSQVPQAGTAAELGLPDKLAEGAKNGDQVYQFVNGQYAISTFDDLEDAFTPALGTLAVGDAIFLKRTDAGSWDRTFNVNQ